MVGAVAIGQEGRHALHGLYCCCWLALLQLEGVEEGLKRTSAVEEGRAGSRERRGRGGEEGTLALVLGLALALAHQGRQVRRVHVHVLRRSG